MKGIGKEKKINKIEITLAFNSGFASTANKEFVLSRYSSMENLEAVPFVIESIPNKMKPFIEALKNIFGENFNFVLKKKQVRAGKGKLRGRKYKSNPGVLIVKSNSEKEKFKGIDVKSTDEVTIADLYPLGRLTLYTQKALQELNKEGKK